MLELGSLIAGPFCARLLGDYGAEVIKIEAPSAPDPMREWGRHTDEGRSLWWPIQARNKKCITLNLKTIEGQSLLKRLAKDSDVLVENFRPGTLEKWNLGWPELSAVNAGLILVRVSGFGQTGPYRDRAGFGAIGEAMGGLRYITGYADRPPVRVGISIGDALAALFATIGALAALQRRAVSGSGQVVDAAITESVFALLESAVSEFDRLGHVRERSGNILPGIAPSNVYPTKDGYLAIGANQDGVFRRLAAVMGQEELAEDPRYATHTARGRHQAELDERIAVFTRTLTKDELWKRLNDAGVPAGPLYSVADIASDPQFRERGMIRIVEDALLGEIAMPGIVPRFESTPGTIRSSGPAYPGEHNEEVYKGLLGIADDEFAALKKQGVI